MCVHVYNLHMLSSCESVEDEKDNLASETQGDMNVNKGGLYAS